MRRQDDTGNIIRDIGGNHDEVLWRIVRINMDKVLDHRKGEMFCGVRDASAGTGPASTK